MATLIDFSLHGRPDQTRHLHANTLVNKMQKRLKVFKDKNVMGVTRISGLGSPMILAKTGLMPNSPTHSKCV